MVLCLMARIACHRSAKLSTGRCRRRGCQVSGIPARLPELLAPAGSADALRAAVSAGADAVYLGVGEFNARRGAENFTLDSLAGACDYAHLRDARVYLTLNVVLQPNELGPALELVDQAWARGIDALIVQDLGLLDLVLTQLAIGARPRLHASSTPTPPTPSERCRRAGVSRVTLARETSLPEIGALSAVGREVGVEVESFVHGALCVCYSGQCLLSSMVGRPLGQPRAVRAAVPAAVRASERRRPRRSPLMPAATCSRRRTSPGSRCSPSSSPPAWTRSRSRGA